MSGSRGVHGTFVGRSHVPEPHRRFRAIIRFLFATFARYYFSYTIEGAENIPDRGPYILVVNHASALDAAFIGILPLKGEARFLAKREAFDEPLVGPFMQAVGAFPVDRDTLDASAARIMLEILKEGQILGLAPEGTRTRTGKIQEFKPGFVKLAWLARVPILPIAIVGSYGILPTPYKIPRRAHIIIRVGQLFELKEYYGKRLNDDEMQQISNRVREKIIELLNRPSYSGA